MKNQKGITVVQLIITIIILFILTGVVIATLVNEDIIDLASRASKAYSDAAEEELEMLNSIENMNMTSDGNNSYVPNDVAPVATIKSDLQSAPKNVSSNDIIIAKDDDDNKITIPNGFKLVSEDDKTVKDGIVIEDNQGNQYVWIPVNQKVNGTKIKLVRSNFVANEIKNESVIDEYYYGEEDSNSCIKDTDYDIEQFKKSVEEYGGFYIGRYETGTATLRTEESEELTDPVIKDNIYSYNYVTRNQALELSQKVGSLYGYTSTTTTLCNSYAWDTALKFLNTSTDSNIATANKQYGGSDEAVSNLDGANIYDMISNHAEWTTEYSSNDIFKCVGRGGYFSFNDAGNKRSFYDEDFKSSCVGFRVIMYLNVEK